MEKYSAELVMDRLQGETDQLTHSFNGRFTVSDVFHVELGTSKLPFDISSIVNLIDRLFEHRNQCIDQDSDTNEGEQPVDGETQITTELIKGGRVRVRIRLVT